MVVVSVIIMHNIGKIDRSSQLSYAGVIELLDYIYERYEVREKRNVK